MRRLVTAVLAALLTVAGVAPAAAEEQYVDLSVSAEFDKVAYLPTELVTLRVRVTNSGTAAASGVVLRSTGTPELFTAAAWGEFADGGPGVKLAPGEQKEISLITHPNDLGEGMTQQVEIVSAEQDRDPRNNRDTLTAFVTVEQADLTLTMYGDADRDGVVDKGETLAGVLVKVFGGLRFETYEGRTDAAGVLHLPGIPGGEYGVAAGLPNGWHLDLSTRVRMRAGNNEVALRAVHHDLTKLHATLALDRASYAPFDRARARVTLTNSGATDIAGLYARCGGLGIEYGGGNNIEVEDWGEFDSNRGGPGVTVRAGETRTWEVTGIVGPKSWDYGFAVLKCEFGVSGASAGAFAEARAEVPGGRGAVAGVLHMGEQPTPGIKLLMVDPTTGEIAGRATSDASGRFHFPDLPAGEYGLRLVGPWRWADFPAFNVQVQAGLLREYRLAVIPGPTQLDPDAPTAPPAPTMSTVDKAAVAPKPQASPRPANLADTGADVANLTAFGVLLMVAGALLLRARRPRRT